MTEAEGLADKYFRFDALGRKAAIVMLESYGRLVQEAAAKSLDDECERVLSKQTDAEPGSFDDGVNKNLRFIAVLLPDRAKAIREMDLP